MRIIKDNGLKDNEDGLYNTVHSLLPTVNTRISKKVLTVESML